MKKKQQLLIRINKKKNTLAKSTESESKKKCELKLKIYISSNKKYRIIVGLESTITNTSSDSIEISDCFDYEDFKLIIFDDQGYLKILNILFLKIY